jgi:hypothetical protein
MTLLAVTAALALSGSAFAQKKPGGGGGTETPPSGNIYFAWHTVRNGVLHKDHAVMRSDGSNKLRLPGVSGQPSHLTYGPAGHRWFLHARSLSAGNYPNGQVRREIFLVREDGSATVQLTDDASVELQSVRWSPGDAFVSAIGRRWNEAGGVVPESVGFYAASVVFDSDGHALGLDGAPEFVRFLGTKLDSTGHLTSDAQEYDWSPNLQQIVYGQSSTSRLFILDLLSGNSRLLTSGASPLWSPDGSRIAFYTFSTADEVVTISPDGKNRMTLVKGTSKFGVSPSAWSPTGGHLLYYRWDKSYATASDIYRITATGGSNTNLTSDIDEAAGAIGWR